MFESWEVGGIRLRPWEPEDAEAVFALVEAERERLRRWLPWVDHTDSAYDISDFIRRSRNDSLEGRSVVLGMFEDGCVIGGVGAAIGVHGADEADIGYWVVSSAEGRGVVTAAVLRLVAWLFEEGMHRITIRAAVDNTRSRAVAERLGFTFEGVLREALFLDGRHRDAALYSLLRGEWSEPRSGA